MSKSVVYYKVRIKLSQNDMKKTWNIVRDATNDTPLRDKNTFKITNEDSALQLNLEVIANTFNAYFANVGADIIRNIECDVNQGRLLCNMNFIFLNPIIQSEI